MSWQSCETIGAAPRSAAQLTRYAILHVTLDVTLAGVPIVTLAPPFSLCGTPFEGNEVEEVEDPPFSPAQGDSDG